MSRLGLLVPARNAEAFLPRLFASIERQTVPFDEVLVYDDASADRTGPMARAHGARVIRGEAWQGPSAGKDVLAEATACDWLHFHDADDALHPEFVERARLWMTRDDADVVLFATEDRDDVTDRVLAEREWDDAALVTDPLRYIVQRTVTNCGLYRRSAFQAAGGFDTRPAVRYNEDQALHVRLALARLRFRSDPLRGVRLYQRAGSMSSANRVACAQAQVEVLADVAGRAGPAYAKEIGARAWHLAGVCGGYSDWASVRRCLDMAHALDCRVPAEEHLVVRAIARVNPLAAVVIREWLIRALKPQLRRDMPRVGRTASPSAAGR
jgi:glycosyltransferase involved in cell wall biosynthesis